VSCGRTVWAGIGSTAELLESTRSEQRRRTQDYGGHHHATSQEGCHPCEEGRASEGCRSDHCHPEALGRFIGGQPRSPKKQAEAVLGDMVALTTRHLKKGDKIRLTGLGILQVRKRAARMGRNPATGEAIKIKASKKIGFRPAKELKEAV
jgi:DNA-binding protein HU-beta